MKSSGGESISDWNSQQGIEKKIKRYLIEKNEEAIQ